MDKIKLIFLFALLGLGAADDCRRMKIDNLIIFFGILSAGYLRCGLWGEDILSFLKDAVLPLSVLFVFYCTGGLGGGDLKLFSVISSFIGFEKTLYVIFFSGCVALIFFGIYRLSGKGGSRVRLALPIMIGTAMGIIYTKP